MNWTRRDGCRRLLAARISGGAMQGQLFEPPPQWHAPVAVRTDQVRVERARSFGGVWLGWMLWRSLELDRRCEAHDGARARRSPWAVMAAVLVVALLCEPSSELHIAEDWYRHTALEDLCAGRGRDVGHPTHRVAGGGHPPPASTEPSVQMSG